MNKIWDITICNGHDKVGHCTLDAKIKMEEVISYMIWLAYTKKQWKFTSEVMGGDDITIDFVEKDEEVCIYCTNLIPDIIIKKVDLSIPNLLSHNMTVHIKRNGQLEE